MAHISELFNAVVEGKIEEAGVLAGQALKEGMEAGAILNQTLVPAMAEVGERFERNEYYIPNMLISAEAMKNALEILKPAMVLADVKPVGTVAIGTIQGDLHDIGKNLVAVMLEGNGFQVINLGVDVKPNQFATAVKEQKVNIIAISALLTSTMINMKNVLQTLEQEGLRNHVKVIIGGAPVTQAYADKIGADGFSENANSTVALAKCLVLSKRDCAQGEVG